MSVSAFGPCQRTLPDGDRSNSSDGSRFYIKGVAYQPQGTPVLRLLWTTTDHSLWYLGQASNDPNNPFLEPATFIDPLADTSGCARDVPYLQQLGVNVVRVYSVDNTQNHDSCMSALDKAGIYTMYASSLTPPLRVI